VLVHNIGALQPDFLKARYLVDGIMVMSEVMSLVKRTWSQCLVLKVDF